MPFFTDTGTSALRAKSFSLQGGAGFGLPIGNPFDIEEGQPEPVFKPNIPNPFDPFGNYTTPGTSPSPIQSEAPTSQMQSWLQFPWPGTTPVEGLQATPRYGETGFTPGMPGGISPGRTNVQTRDLVTDFFQAQYDDWYQKVQGQLDAARAQASPTLEGLEDQLALLRGADVDPLFQDYYATRKEAGAELPPAPLAPSNAPAVLEKQYDDAEGELRKSFEQLDMNMGTEAANTMVKDMRTYEAVTGDMLRTDLDNIGMVHDLNAKVADAMAKAAYSGDILAAKEAQVRINAELDFKTDQTAKDLERNRRALDAQLRAIRDANPFEAADLNIDDVVDARWAEMMSQKGYAAHDVQSARDIWEIIKGDASAMTSESNFRTSMTSALNESSLAKFGFTLDDYGLYIDEKVARMVAASQATDTPMTDEQAASIVSGYEANFHRFLTTADLGKWVHSTAYADDFVNQMMSAGMSRPDAIGLFNRLLEAPDKVASTTGTEASILRDMYTTREYVYTNWDQISASYGPSIDQENVYSTSAGAFPIVGGAQFTNSWGAPRGGGTRKHQGTDLMAARGTPIVASVNGTVQSIDSNELGGLYVKIKALDGSVHYLAHMDSQAGNLKVGQKVYQGRTFLGTVGNTGNARTTAPHVHYGIYINGKAVPSYAFLKSVYG